MSVTKAGAEALAGLVADSAVLNTSLRDLFAAFALSSLINTDYVRSVSHPDQAAADSYKFADAMLAQRSKES